MSLISIVVTLAVIGLILWAIETVVPMDDTIRKVIRVVIIVVVALWFLQEFGLMGSIGAIRIR